MRQQLALPLEPIVTVHVWHEGYHCNCHIYTLEPSICEVCGPRVFVRRPSWWKCQICGRVFAGKPDHTCDPRGLI